MQEKRGEASVPKREHWESDKTLLKSMATRIEGLINFVEEHKKEMNPSKRAAVSEELLYLRHLTTTLHPHPESTTDHIEHLINTLKKCEDQVIFKATHQLPKSLAEARDRLHLLQERIEEQLKEQEEIARKGLESLRRIKNIHRKLLSHARRKASDGQRKKYFEEYWKEFDELEKLAEKMIDEEQKNQLIVTLKHIKDKREPYTSRASDDHKIAEKYLTWLEETHPVLESILNR